MVGTPTTAQIGFGTKISAETFAGSGAYFEMGELIAVTVPNPQVAQVKATHMQSPDRTEEYIPGLTELGDAKYTVNWIPSNATDAFVMAWIARGDKCNTRIDYPAPIGGGVAPRDSFLAFPTGISPTVPLDDRMTAEITLKVAGARTRS